MKNLKQQDPEIYNLIKQEISRQKDGLVMIPSENYASEAVIEAMGTPLSNKYAEGYPYKRYYTGNQYIDQIETLAIERAKKLFNAEHANVQPNAGSPANFEAYYATLQPGDKILALDLAHGGHLTHGGKANFSSKLYNFVYYGVDEKTEIVDMEKVREIALREKPKMIVTGATAYPRKIDFEKFYEISKEIDGYLLADISHIVGLCLAGLHQNPAPYADIVTTTTHKTLRGPRSAIIVCKENDRYQEKYHPNIKKNLAQRIDFAVFPGMQGGPMEHIIAAKAACFKEAMTEEFKEYQKQIVKNAKVLAEILMENGLRLVSGGTDNHLMLIDCRNIGITGKIGSEALAMADIYTNRNTIPFETGSPFDPSGIRLGAPALTTRGMKEGEMRIIGKWISDILHNVNNEELIGKVKNEVKEMTMKFPIYEDL
ncbi:MAG: serine hydroxymethyltransferase [bacterium]